MYNIKTKNLSIKKKNFLFEQNTFNPRFESWCYLHDLKMIKVANCDITFWLVMNPSFSLPNRIGVRYACAYLENLKSFQKESVPLEILSTSVFFYFSIQINMLFWVWKGVIELCFTEIDFSLSFFGRCFDTFTMYLI